MAKAEVSGAGTWMEVDIGDVRVSIEVQRKGMHGTVGRLIVLQVPT